MMQFPTVGIIGRPGSQHIEASLRWLVSFLRERGHQVVLESGVATLLQDDSSGTVEGVSCAPLDTLGQHCDVAIVLGGDGSLLGAGRALCASHTPIIGVNGGRVGFLTDIPADEMEPRLTEILNGHYDREQRLLLDSRIERNGKEVSYGLALNDVVVHAGQVARLIEFDLYIDDQFVYRQRSDGLIIATPTGSTAYGLSAGGPILHPSLDALALVPMCPHTLSSRPLVVSAASRIRLDICANIEQHPSIACDGQSVRTAQVGDSLHITRNPSYLELLHPKGHSFYESCRSKLGWTQHGR